MLFFKKRKSEPERIKKEIEGDALHEQVMEKIKKLDKETKLFDPDSEVSYRIFIAMGGDRRPPE